MIQSDENRMRDGLIVLLQVMGDQKAKFDEARNRSGENGMRVRQAEIKMQRAESWSEALQAVVNTAKERSGGNCVVCREHPIQYPDISLCVSCRNESYKHGMPR